MNAASWKKPFYEEVESTKADKTLQDQVKWEMKKINSRQEMLTIMARFYKTARIKNPRSS